LRGAIKYLREILDLLGDKRRKLPWLLILFLSSSVLDILGLGLIGPYVSLLSDPNSGGGFIQSIASVFGFFGEETDLLLIGGLFLVGIFIAKASLVILINFSIIKFSQNQMVQLRSTLMHRYQNLDYSEYLCRNSSEYINSLGNLIGRFGSGVVLSSLKTLSEITVAVILLIFLAVQNLPAMLLLIFMAGCLLFVYDQLFRPRISVYGERATSASRSIIQEVQEGIYGLKEIRVLGKTKYFRSKVLKSSKEYAENYSRSQILIFSPRYILESLVVCFVVLLVLGTRFTGQGADEIIPTLAVFGLASLRLMPCAQGISSSLLQLQYNRKAVSILHSDFVSTNNPYSNTSAELFKKNELVPFKELFLDSISFSYPNAKSMALDSISLTIKEGESIGIIGSSGSGKTTLVDLLLGFLISQKGTVFFNGVPLSDCLREWSRNVAYLPQEVFLVDDTLKRNIALGVSDSEISEKRIEQSIHKARLQNLVSNMPQGIETIIGERGARLSGGQRQRIALARAFYHERSILVMDESTSALDLETEKEIIREIERLKGSMTIIVIAHRESTLKYCDRIYEMSKGHIIGEFKCDEIMKSKNLSNSNLS
jgi:ABC-type bacteriocin/lantibiotic exporter with double-glycine peptidase domain